MSVQNYVPVANFADVSQSGKLAVLDHLLKAIRAENQRVVVVSNYIQTLDMLAHYLKARGYDFLRLDGTTPAGARPGIVEAFNATYNTKAFVSVHTLGENGEVGGKKRAFVGCQFKRDFRSVV